MNDVTAMQLQKRVRSIQSLPTPPVIFRPLMDLFRQPIENVEIKEVTKLVSYDKSLAALCLRVANSPLFGRAKSTESVQAAVLSLGVRRVEEILLTCCLQQMMPKGKWGPDPVAFWKHSLGCAFVSRKFAEMIGYADGEKAYVAGLLHDLGIVVNAVAYRSEFSAVMAEASKKQLKLEELEEKRLGFTHCDSGFTLAQVWQLPEEVCEVIRFHHHPQAAPQWSPLVAVVHLCDLLCRLRGLGYGYYEAQEIDFLADPAWVTLSEQFPKLAQMDLARFTFDLDGVVGEVALLVDSIFTPTLAS
jgi:putative nucleotidyltransferase with HDIG domain